MAQFRVNASFMIRDALTGKTLADSGLSCEVDGVPYRPVMKNEGYAVMVNLLPGEHTVTFSRYSYEKESYRFTVGNQLVFDVLTMKPAEGYRVPPCACRVKLTGAKAGQKVWVAQKPSTKLEEIKLNQATVEAGTQTMRLFMGGGAIVRMPEYRLVCDKDAPELCILSDRINEEEWKLYAPLTKNHKRGVFFYAAQSYTAKEDGTVDVVLPMEMEFVAFYNGKLISGEAKEGENVCRLS